MPDTQTVADYMTATPATVNEDLTLADAMDRMYADNIRHLPVVNDAGNLVGMVSTRDIAVAASIRNQNPNKITVGGAMSGSPVTCAANTALEEVALMMEKHRLGSVIVTDNGKPVGMFTTTDAMRALRTMIAGAPVEPAVTPTHIVEDTGEQGRATRSHHRGARPSSKDGTLSWFLGGW